MTAFDDLRRDLSAGRERLLAAIAGVSEEQFKRRPPAPDTPPATLTNTEEAVLSPSEPGITIKRTAEPKNWSIAEILAHLLYSERLWGTGIALALTQDGVKIQAGALEAREEDARRGRMSPVPQLVHGLLASRRQVELLLDQAAALEDGLQRYVLHPADGRLTVEWMVREKIMAHEAEYIARIEALRAEMGVTPAGVAS